MATKEELFAAVRMLKQHCINLGNRLSCGRIKDEPGCPLENFCYNNDMFDQLAPSEWPDPEEGDSEDGQFHIREIVKALRCCGKHDDNECYQCPFRGKYSFNDCAFDLYLKAADLVDSLLHKLCSLCAVCPADKRTPYDCEVIGTCKEGGGETDKKTNCSGCGNQNTPVCKYCDHDAEGGGENGK